MPFLFTVSPDFNPLRTSDWFVLNTWLQGSLGVPVHLELFDGFEAQRHAIDTDAIDLIYCNPYDAARLVREKGFLPIVQPVASSDEAIIAVRADSPVERVEDLAPGTRAVTTDDPDVYMMSMIMLEPANLSRSNVQFLTAESYPGVVKHLLDGTADVGFFLKTAHDELSPMIRSQVRPLVSSKIHVLHHALLAGPRLADRADDLRRAFLGMGTTPDGTSVMEGVGVTGWQALEQEEVEFMIDLMDTLLEH